MRLTYMLGLSIGLTVPIGALAQPYPSKPVRMIVGFTPGGGADTIARVLGAKFSERTKQPVVIDNRPGAGGMVGTVIVKQSAPDGYNLLLANANFVTNPVLYSNAVMYDAAKDFAPVYQLGSSQYLLSVNLTVPANTVKELVALAKSRPGRLNAASAGLGGPGHLSIELFKMLTGTDIVHIPYKGTAPVLTSVLANETQIIFGNVGATIPLVQAGKVRGLAVTGAVRSVLAPDFPTVADAGIPGFEVSSWYGIFGPKALPRDIVQFLYREFAAISEMRDAHEKLVSAGLEVAGAPPEKFGAYVQSEVAKWTKVVRTAGIRLE